MAENQEKLQGTDIKLTSSNKFLKWLENFWYYHKWKVIVISFFAVVIAVSVAQMVNKTDPDIEVTVATHTVYYQENVDSLESTIKVLMQNDVNGDGKKTVQLNLYKIYSEAELKAANEKETDAEGNPVIYADEAYNKEQIEQYNSYLMTGQCTIMIISEYLYNDLANRRSEDVLLKPMSEIFGENLPEGVTADGYGIKLTATGAYKNLDAFRSLPTDSVICIMRPFVMSGGSGEKRHNAALECLKAIVEFGN